MRELTGFRQRQITRMNVPVHQIMFTPDRDALPPPAAEEIRSRAGGDLYRMWVLDDARALIGDVYGPEVLTAFDILRPFAYKADLARYCIVNYIGGLYIDLSITDFLGFDVSDYEFVGFRIANTTETGWKVANGLFYSTKDSLILQDSISQCVANVRRRFYGKDPLFPTGPRVLGRAVTNRSLEVRVQIGDERWLKRRRNKYTLPDRGIVARGKVGGRYLGGVSAVSGGNNYNVMWRDRTIYGLDDLMHRRIGSYSTHHACDATRRCSPTPLGSIVSERGGMASDSTNESPRMDAAEIQPGRRRQSTRCLRLQTLLAPMGLSRVALKAAPVFAGRAAVLNFVAHPDDDLLFLSPDLLHAIQAGGNVRTVYLTAGDAGQHASSYWQDRESGVRAAYAEMAGVANSWTQSDAGVTGHPIPVFTLTDQRNVSLAFMRLPDGDVNGSGFASNGYQSLQGLWTGSTAIIEAVDRSSSYTLSTLTSTLAYLIASFQPEHVNTQDYRRTYGDGDHSDHHTVGYLTRSAMGHCNSSVAFIGYEGYPVVPLPANVSDADQKAKQSAFLAYAQHDKLVWDLLAKGASTPYDSWLVRQYRVNQPRSLIAHCRGLTWRVVRRARLDKSFAVILSFAVRAKRGLLAKRRSERDGRGSHRGI